MITPRSFRTAAWLPPALSLFLVSGCNLAPRYSRPAMAVPAKFREAPVQPAVAWVPAEPGDETARGQWWRIYGDPTLDTLETQVAVSNQTIIQAEANFRAARAAVASARSALFPTVTATPSVTRARSSQEYPTGEPGISDAYVAPADATYEVDLWHRVRNLIAVSAANAQASAADLATALLGTQAELAQDYLQLRALDAERGILDDTVNSDRQALDVTTTLFESGIDSDEDVARARTQLDTTVAQASDTGVARAAYEHAIAVLIGKPPAELSLPASPLSSRPPAVPAVLPSELLERRPDIAAAERRAAAANAEIGVARAAYFPSLVLGASGGWESLAFSQWFDWPSRFWSIGPQLATTLFDGGARKAATDQARAEFDAAAAGYRQTVLTALQAVEDNLAALRILQGEAEQQRVAVESARHLLDLSMSRYQAGIDSYLDVVTAQTALLSNREAEVQVQLRQMTSSVALVMALGGGWTIADLPRTRSLAANPLPPTRNQG